MKGKDFCNDFKLDLDPDTVDQLLYHGSFKQEPCTRNKNKLMTDFGHAVIRLLTGLYYYIEQNNRNAEELSRITQWKDVELGFYNENKLEEYIYKSNGEMNSKHPDAASRIIAQMYLSWGLIRTYDYLIPFIKKYSVTENTDYKTQVQEYAQKYKIPFSYNIIDVQGPGHELVYTCQLTVGSNKVTASAAGKKKAERAAAEEYIKRYHIKSINQSSKSTTMRFHQPTISENRILVLEKCLDLIGLPPKIVPISEINVAFTHRSTNVRQRKVEENSALIVIGALLMRAYAYDYVFSHYEYFANHATDSVGILLRTDSYVGFIPKQWLKALHAEKTVFMQNDSAFDKIRTDLYASVQGVLIVNAIRNHSEYLEGVSKDNARDCLQYSHRHKVYDYRTVLQELAQKHDVWVNTECKEHAALPDNSYVFFARIECIADRWELSTSAYGKSIKQATNAASKKMIAKILPYFSGDEDDMEKISMSMDPEEWEQEMRKAEKVKSQNASVANRTSSLKNEDGTILYIFKDASPCRKQGHKITVTTREIDSLHGKIKISINYCTKCNRYFWDYQQYSYYREMYGVLLANFVMLEHNGNGYGFDNMASESILRICGYTVNQNDNLSESERRHILKYLMDKRIIEKHRIIEYLQFFINNSHHRANMKTAQGRWESDLNWVKSYDLK